MAETVNIHEAKTHLSRLLERVQAGEEITIAKAGKPIAVLTAVRPRLTQRIPGMDKGKVIIHDDFDDPLPEFDPDHMHPEDPMRDLLR
jgi:prevent-host-death family protein